MESSFHENTIVSGHRLESFLGSGRFANVWKALPATIKTGGGKKKINHNTQCLVALKIYSSDPHDYKYFAREIRINNAIKVSGHSPHIVAFHGWHVHIAAIDDIPHVFPVLSFECMQCELSELIAERGFTDWRIVKKAASDIFAGLSLLHSANIAHRDIKPDNLLVSNSCENILRGEGFTVKLCDFGSSHIMSDPAPENGGGTIDYAPYEQIAHHAVLPAVDIWAAFITIYELLTNHLLFDLTHRTRIKYNDAMLDDPNRSETESSNSDAIAETSLSSSGTRSCHCGAEHSGDCDDFCDLEKYIYMIEKLLGSTGQQFDSPPAKIDLPTLFAINGYKLTEDESREFAAFILCGLQFDPAKRISAKDAAELPFLQLSAKGKRTKKK